MLHIFDDVVITKRALRELVILRKIQGPFMIKLFDVIIPDNYAEFNEVYMVLERCETDLK